MAHATTQFVTALSQTLRRHAAACEAELAAARRGESESVHRLRVATRRLRAALPLVDRHAPTDTDEALRAARRLTRAFGAIREVDVARDVLAAFATRHPWTAPVVARVDAHCTDLRARELASVRKRVGPASATTLRARVETLADRVEAGLTHRAIGVAWLVEVSRRARQLVVALDRASTVYGVDALHRVRIASKKLRYVIELGHGYLSPATERAALKTLKRLQARLGDLHDLQVSQHYVRAAAVASATAARRGAEVNRVDEALEIECRRLHAQMIQRNPEVEEVLLALQRDVTRRVAMRDLRRSVRMRSAAVRRTRVAS